MNEREFAELAAGHALHALSASDERAFQTARAANPEWEHHVRGDAAVADALAEAAPAVAPPPAIRAALLAQIASVPQTEESAPAPSPPSGAADDTARGDRSSRSLSRRGLFALAASAVLLLVLGVGTVLAAQQLVRPAAVVALERIERAPDARSASATTTDGAEATVHWSDSLGQSVLVTDGFPTLPDDRTFELWYVRGDTAVSAGTFAVDASGGAVALLDGAQQPGDVVAVTVEQAGGSPGGAPTTDPVIVITT